MIYFSDPITYGHLIKRYKRFFMDVRLPKGEVITAHTPNTGSMYGLLQEGRRVMLTASQDRKRKTSHTVQAIEIDGGLVGINTHLPNRLIRESLHHPLLRDLSPYDAVKAEVPYGENLRSRVDLYFSKDGGGLPPLFLEIKNVTMRRNELAQFPDAPSDRARKHITDLMNAQEMGARAAMFFIVQRQDCNAFRPAQDIDPQYAHDLKEAVEAGLWVRALCARIDQWGLAITHEIPCDF
jgi:sugar fermentation stimulation protein A